MSNPLLTKSSLVGRRFVASISEPWDFKSVVGANRLEGTILAELELPSKRACLLCDVSSFVDGEREITRVGVTCRRWDTESPKDLLTRKRIAVGMFYSIDIGILDETTVSIYMDNRSRSHFLLGSVQLY